MLKKWEDITNDIKNETTKKYYDSLEKKKIQLYLKRLFDIIVSSILIIMLFPFMLVIYIMIKLDSQGSPIFKQKRVTTYGKIFTIYKFRTMTVDAPKIGSAVTTLSDARITNIGSKLRKCRLDELPQLFNILFGDMSFVGTRPEVPKYVEKYADEMKATLLLPAGVTSTASIKFKDEDEIIEKGIKLGQAVDDIYINEVLPQKMKINLLDIRKFSFFRDIKIMLDTVWAVIK